MDDQLDYPEGAFNIAHWRNELYGLRCGQCGTEFTRPQHPVLDYCRGEHVVCSNCRKTVTWLAIIDSLATGRDLWIDLYSTVQAKTCFFNMVLRAEREEHLVFTALGLPETVRVLDVNFTPVQIEGQTGCFMPLVLHGNSPSRRWGRMENGFSIYPMPTPARSAPTVGNVNVSLIWVDRAELTDQDAALVDGVDAFFNRRPRDVVIPANVAMELATARLVDAYVMSCASRQNAERFLDAVTYGHRLNVLVPMLARAHGLPALHSDVRGRLNRLRALRNDLAHDGATDLNLERSEAALLISACLVGVEYMANLAQAIGPKS